MPQKIALPELKNKKHQLLPSMLGLALLMENLDTTVLNTAIPKMALTFNVDPLSMKLSIVSYLLTLAIFIPVSGYWAKRYGAKRVFCSSIVIFLISSALCGFSQSIGMLIMGRLLQGVGGAMMLPVGRLILLKTFSKIEFVRAFSALSLIGQFGVALGPLLGGIFTTCFNWRGIFFINIPIGLIALGAILYLLPKETKFTRPNFDQKGFLLFAITISCITAGSTLITEDHTHFFISALLMLISGGILLALFGIRATRQSQPLLHVTLFKIRTFRIATLGSLVVRLSINAPFFLLTLLFQIVFGFSALKAGAFLIPYGVSMIIAKRCVPIFLLKKGFRYCLTVNSLAIALLLTSFAYFSSQTPEWLILLLIALLGFVSSLQFTYMNTLNFSDIDPEYQADSTTLSSVLQQLAMNLSVCFSAALLSGASFWHHTNILNEAVFHDTFIVLSFVALLSLWIFSQLKKTDGERFLH